MSDYDLFNEYLTYDPQTGSIIWKKSPSRPVRAGSEAGHTGPSRRYRDIHFKGNLYKSHRVAWLLYYGRWPVNDIDHKDGDRLNNRIDNLRDVPHKENMRNRPLQTNNTSGITGVSWKKSKNRWLAYIYVDTKLINLGLFRDLSEACKRRLCAEYLLGFHTNHGRTK